MSKCEATNRPSDRDSAESQAPGEGVSARDPSSLPERKDLATADRELLKTAAIYARVSTDKQEKEETGSPCFHSRRVSLAPPFTPPVSANSAAAGCRRASLIAKEGSGSKHYGPAPLVGERAFPLGRPLTPARARDRM